MVPGRLVWPVSAQGGGVARFAHDNTGVPFESNDTKIFYSD